MLENAARPQHLHVGISYVSKHAEENKTKHGYVFWTPPTKREEGTTMMNNKSTTGFSLKPPKTPKPCVLTYDGHSTATNNTSMGILQLTVENTTSPPFALKSCGGNEYGSRPGAPGTSTTAHNITDNTSIRVQKPKHHITHNRGLENGSLQTHTHTRMEISPPTGSTQEKT